MENNPDKAFYTTIGSMEPLFPEDSSGKLEGLALDLIEKAGRLSGAMNPITREAIAGFLRPMNSYYSNLIEGHDTHPIDIDKALNNNYSKNKDKRDLQREASAHINVHKTISEDSANGKLLVPSSINFLKYIHAEFYKHLPEEFRKSKTLSGEFKEVIPGEFRTCEVQIGKHLAPHSDSLNSFMTRFESFYDPNENSNRKKIRRIISIAASHHRLAWIHPFLDGNGRVVRLYSDASFMHEKLDANGLWSISRGLARSKSEYQERLANADLIRFGNHDGRGNLSNKMLEEFCIYFLERAIDQVEYMYKMIDSESMVSRIEKLVELLVTKELLKPEAKYLLVEVFLRGKVSRKEAERITRTSDKTLKTLTESLIKMGLLNSKIEDKTLMFYLNYSIKYSPLLFPSLYPTSKEIDLMDYMSE
jgi:Fic family protein